VFCLSLPSRDDLARLAKQAEPVVFVTGAQLPYLRSIAAPLTPLKLASGADRAQDRAEALRVRITQVLEGPGCEAELAVLDPLFERFDPAEVAAALLVLQRDAGEERREAPPATQGTERKKVFVNVGKKDRVTAKDLVGALIREAKVPKGDLGRIEVRETFSIVEVSSAAAARVVQELAGGGVTIRGRRVSARLDRYT
jgi:ATP-dependent RNA helicase DeaD